MKSCVVSFVDSEGVRHSVELQAESLYEAAVLGVKLFRQHKCPPAPLHELQVDVTTAVRHTLTIRKLEAWLGSNCRSPKERDMKARLKALLLAP